MSEKKRYPVALIGAGRWGLNILAALVRNSNAEVVAVSDKSEAAASRVRQIIPNVRICDLTEILQAEEIAACFIASGAETHFEVASRVLGANKACFVEKPLATTGADAEHLVRIAREQQNLLMVGHVFLYNPACDFIKEQLRDGALGRLCHISFRRANLGPVRQDVSAMWDLAPHDISLAIDWFGESPHGVLAAESAVLPNSLGDFARLNLLFSKGRQADIYVSWLNPYKDRQVVVVGDRKAIVWDDTIIQDPIKIFYQRLDRGEDPTNYIGYQLNANRGETIIPVINFESPLDREINHFFECLRKGATPRSDGEHARIVVNILEAASLSVKLGQTVPFPVSRSSTAIE